MLKTRELKLNDITIGGTNPLALIAGPCVIENEQHTLQLAETISAIAAKHGIGYIFKASYDKANRSSIDSYRGPGIENGLAILKTVKEQFNCPILTDIHAIEEIEPAAQVADILQIPAFLCRQTDLVVAAGKSGRIINVKKGQFLAPWDIQQVIKKIESTGCKNITLTERGISFGYNNLVSDMRSLMIMRETGYPVIYDATHSVQLPGGEGTSSGGQSQFVPALARAAVAIGIDALFIEVHDNPAEALSDGPNCITPTALDEMLALLKDIDQLVKSRT